VLDPEKEKERAEARRAQRQAAAAQKGFDIVIGTPPYWRLPDDLVAIRICVLRCDDDSLTAAP
jgi:hypothetical protein